MAKLIEIRRTNPKGCPHYSFLIDEVDRVVNCGQCREQIDPLDALMILANDMVLAKDIWWKEHGDQNSFSPEQQRVTKVTKAALELLYDIGVSPAEYSERWTRLCEMKARTQEPTPAA